MIDHHRRRTGYPCAVPEDALDQLEAAGGEGGGAAIDHLAYAGEQLVVGLGEVASDDDGPRVEQVDRRGEHLPDEPTGFADRLDGVAVSGLDQGNHGTGVCSARAWRPTPVRRPPTPDSRCCHNDRQPVGCCHLDVSDVPGSALGAAVEPASEDQPRADAGPDLDEEEIVRWLCCDPVLTHGHDVDVVVDQHRHVISLHEAVPDRVTIPTGHDRWGHRSSGGELDRPRHTDADPLDITWGSPGGVEQYDKNPIDGAEDVLGTRGDVQVEGRVGDRRCSEVGDGHTGVCGAKVHSEHHAGLLVEPEEGRRSASARRRLADLGDQTFGDEMVDPVGDGGAGETGGVGELRRVVASPVRISSRSIRATHFLPQFVH